MRQARKKKVREPLARAAVEPMALLAPQAFPPRRVEGGVFKALPNRRDKLRAVFHHRRGAGRRKFSYVHEIKIVRYALKVSFLFGAVKTHDDGGLVVRRGVYDERRGRRDNDRAVGERIREMEE